ncbi:MAG TPA: hypothetical protein VNV42_00400, partial [Solirubrobacteraceae bacterium]|nr:hypothetical protein [Solirubrobacteraceae bacterium]
MSRFKFVLLSMLAVMSVGAASLASSASAHEFVLCMKVGPGHKYETKLKCEKGEIGSGEWERVGIGAGELIPAEGISGTSKLEGEAGGVKIIIECAEDTFSGELEAGGASKGEVKFKNCKVLKKNTKTQLESCTVKEPIEFKFKDQ